MTAQTPITADGRSEGWISVKDQLPDINLPVLCGNSYWPRTVIGQYKGNDDWTGFLDATEEIPEGDPTHWQPLPALPKEQP